MFESEEFSKNSYKNYKLSESHILSTRKDSLNRNTSQSINNSCLTRIKRKLANSIMFSRRNPASLTITIVSLLILQANLIYYKYIHCHYKTEDNSKKQIDSIKPIEHNGQMFYQVNHDGDGEKYRRHNTLQIDNTTSIYFDELDSTSYICCYRNPNNPVADVGRHKLIGQDKYDMIAQYNQSQNRCCMFNFRKSTVDHKCLGVMGLSTVIYSMVQPLGKTLSF